MPNIQQINALNKFALSTGRGWRDKVRAHWLNGTKPLYLDMAEAACLQQIRNNLGPEFLSNFKPLEGGYADVVFLKKDQMERLNLKRGGHVAAWRLVTAEGVDRVQPWAATKREACEQAKVLKLYLVESSYIPKFCPRIFYKNGVGALYEDDRVYGAVDEYEIHGKRGITIHEWSSGFPGLGHTTEALTWLRNQGFEHIVANGVGRIDENGPDISVMYWQHMFAKGLVDVLVDDEGIDVSRLKLLKD